MDSSCSTPSSSRATRDVIATRLPHHLQQPSSSSFSDPEVFASTNNIRAGQAFVSITTLTKESFHIAVNAKTRVHDVLWKCGERLAITEDKLFGLAIRQPTEGIGGDQPRHEYYFLDPAAKIMKYAHKVPRFANWHNRSSESRPALVLYFRVRVYIEQVGLLTCPKALEHYYLQLKENFLDHWAGRYSVSEERCWEMAALALKADRGDDYQGYFRAEQYFPLWVIDERGLEYIRNNMPAAGEDLKNLTRHEAMNKFAVEASRSPFALNCHLYGLRRHKMDSVDNAVLGINAKGIEMCDISDSGDRIPLRSLLWNRVTRLSFDRKKLTIVGSDGTKMSLYAQTENKARYLLELCRAVHQTLLVMSHTYARMAPLPQPYHEKSVDRLSTSTTTSGVASNEQDKDSDSLSSACDRGCQGSMSSKLRLRIKMDSNLDVKIEKMELDNIRQERGASQSSKASDDSERSRAERGLQTGHIILPEMHVIATQTSQLPPPIDTARPPSVDSASQTVESGSRSAPVDVNFNSKLVDFEPPPTVQMSNEILPEMSREQTTSTSPSEVDTVRFSSMHDLRSRQPPSYEEHHEKSQQRSYSPPSMQQMHQERMLNAMTRSEPEIDVMWPTSVLLDAHVQREGRFVKKNSAGSRTANAINRVHSMPSHYHVNPYYRSPQPPSAPPPLLDDIYVSSSLHPAHSLLAVPQRPKNPPPYEHPAINVKPAPPNLLASSGVLPTGPLPAEAAGGQPSFPPASATASHFGQVLRDEEGLSTERLRNFPLLHHLWKESHGMTRLAPVTSTRPSNLGHHRRPSSCIDLTSDAMLGSVSTVTTPSRPEFVIDSATQQNIFAKSAYQRVDANSGVYLPPPPPPYPQQLVS